MARDHDIPSKDVVDTCVQIGIDVKSHMSAISERDAKRVLKTIKNRGTRPADDAAEESDRTTQHRRIHAVRLEQLLTLLATRFGCEVEQGKGSEITVYRKGGRKYVLSRHKRNYEVPSAVVDRLLNRLGIGLPDWLAIVYA